MSAVKWVKTQTDIYRNRKIILIRKERNGNDYALVWVFLIALAGESNANGKLMVSETEPFTKESISAVLDFSVEIVSNALELFKKYQMIAIDNGVIELLGWYEYQNADALETQRENARIRQRKWYESHKKPNKPNENLTPSSMLGVALSNAVDVDVESVDVESLDVDSLNNRKKESDGTRIVSFAETQTAMASPNYQRIRQYREFREIHYASFAGVISKMSESEMVRLQEIFQAADDTQESVEKTLKKVRELINLQRRKLDGTIKNQ